MKYTEDHEWLRVEGELVVVGITEHASTQLGDVVFVELPEAETQVSKGDEVVTNGGVLGKITDTDENFVSVEIADGVTVKVQRFAIAQMMPKGTVKSS